MRYVTFDLVPQQIGWLQKQNAALTLALVAVVAAVLCDGLAPPRVCHLIATAGAVSILIAVRAMGKERQLLHLNDRLQAEGQIRSDAITAHLAAQHDPTQQAARRRARRRATEGDDRS